MLKRTIEAKLQSAEDRLSLLESEIKSAEGSMNSRKLKHLKAERVSLKTRISNFNSQLDHLQSIRKNVSIAKEQGWSNQVNLPDAIQKIVSDSPLT